MSNIFVFRFFVEKFSVPRSRQKKTQIFERFEKKIFLFVSRPFILPRQIVSRWPLASN